MSEKDNKVKALQAVYDVLKPLDVQTRQEVIASALALMGMPATAAVTPATAAGTTHEGTRVSTKTPSIREFLQQLKLKRHTDIGLAFGYFLEKHMDKGFFTPADLNGCYYEAKLEKSNTSQMIAQNIKSGRMMQAKVAKGKKGTARGAYTLTSTGEKFIESMLDSSTHA